MRFNISYIEEPKLEFMEGSSYNPMVGLCKYSPRLSTPDEKKAVWAKIGIIGSAQSLSLTRQLFEEMRLPCAPEKSEKWNIPFPGLHEQSKLKLCLSLHPQWQATFNSREIKSILSDGTRAQKAEKYVELIQTKINLLKGKNPPPDVIIVSTPAEVEQACKDPHYDKPLIKLPHNDDLHHRVKIMGMQAGIPTQLIRPDTLKFVGTQEKPIVFWNLALGLLYKSQKGYPWKLTELEQGTCYVGITFYEEHGTKNKRASMAQVFLETGESFIIRGDPFEWQGGEKSAVPHLNKEQSIRLIEKVLQHFKEHTHQIPSRMVVHKSSKYYKEEIEGFEEATKDINKVDLVEINQSSRYLKLFRPTDFAVLRGTLLSVQDQSEHFLFTTGFTPCIGTFPGFGAPIPLILRCPRQDSDIQVIAKEILQFTKLDWNNVFTYRKEPVTLCVSRKVGRVLAETIVKDMKEIDDHYYFYM